MNGRVIGTIKRNLSRAFSCISNSNVQFPTALKMCNFIFDLPILYLIVFIRREKIFCFCMPPQPVEQAPAESELKTVMLFVFLVSFMSTLKCRKVECIFGRQPALRNCCVRSILFITVILHRVRGRETGGEGNEEEKKNEGKTKQNARRDSTSDEQNARC